ncbi:MULTISPECIES: hypothetical protein [unclassified Streptomyces]|uniref:Uncharacterized protein n=1 Tax=Streptomyces sp. NBC_00180 TaxID=2903632 RepID=A0AAU1I2J8_9ACTN|nr:hypothetical protein OG331_31465 [Streptomyces sp. NBC_01017]
MTITAPPTETEGVDTPALGQLLVESAQSGRGRAAAQALAEEGTLLARDNVRAALVIKDAGRMKANWEGLMGRVYTLGLDEQERAFLGLVLSMVGIGITPLIALENLDERRLLILMRALPLLAGNERIAVGTRM